MGQKKFKVVLEPMGSGGKWTCLMVPFGIEKVFGSRARVSVKGTINGFPFRSSIFPQGDGTHFMMVNKAMQEGAGVRLGDTVDVVMEPDTAPRTVTVPGYFRKALSKHRKARVAFEKLSYSHKKEFVDWIDQAKQEETRLRRVEKAIGMLLGGGTPKG